MSGDVRVGRVLLDSIDYHGHNVRVDLGDLRGLSDSIRRFGVMQPVVLERRGERLRIRAGHRRVAAARLAGLTKIEAVIHGEALETDEWLTAAVHENTRRRGLDREDRRRTAEAMRSAGMTVEAIAEAFGVTPGTARGYLKPDPEAAERDRDDRWQERRETVLSMTRQGLSARQIGSRLGLSPRQAQRVRTDNRTLHRSVTRSFAASARERVESGEWSAGDLLDAIDRLVTTCTLKGAMGAREQVSS